MKSLNKMRKNLQTKKKGQIELIIQNKAKAKLNSMTPFHLNKNMNK